MICMYVELGQSFDTYCMSVPFELNGWNLSDLEGVGEVLGLRSRGVRDSLRDGGWFGWLVGLDFGNNNACRSLPNPGTTVGWIFSLRVNMDGDSSALGVCNAWETMNLFIEGSREGRGIA